MLSEVEDFSRLVLLRHPELAPSHAELVLGGGEAPLSRRGRERALVWARDLRSLDAGAVWSADQMQCSEPGSVLAQALGVELHTDERLRDQAMGSWQGRSWAEVAATEPDAVQDFFGRFGEARAPDGESLGQAVERVLAWWHELAPRALGQTAVAILAGNMISGFAAAMLGMRLSRAVCLSLPFGASAILDVYANGARIAAWHPEALRGDVA